jgi:pimeloyl-ACP methyl ester carboxylesterase
MTPLARDIWVDGVRIHLVEAGEGPALILLHGLSATHVNWEHTVPAFADRFRVIAPDLPGHGRSAKPDAPYTTDFYAGIVRSLGSVLGVPEAVVVGNSLGGQIAVELGAAYPAWTRAVVLVAPAGAHGSAARALFRLVDPLAARLMRLALPRALERCFHDPSLPAWDVRRRLLAERLSDDDFPFFSRAVRRSIAGSLAAGDEARGRLAQPTLVVWGREDRFIPLARAQAVLRAVPHARLAVLDACGHLPMLERPAEFNRVVEDFLHGVGVAPARRASGDA